MLGRETIVLTLHARERLAERGLDLSWVEQTVRNPHRVEPNPQGQAIERRFRVIDEAGGRVLRVVCVETNTTIRIITATLTAARGNDGRHDL